MALNSSRGEDPLFLEDLRLTQQITVLWGVFLLGLLFHTQLALMPLFHGLSVLAAHGHVATTIAEIEPVLWGMLAFFILPLLAMVAIVIHPSHSLRLAHLGLTGVYTLLNLFHLAADLVIQPVAWYQIVLMGLLVSVGLLLNRAAYHWVRLHVPHPRRIVPS
ncbi:hypothetical protein GFS31_16130 [Leptolyngbya sp. BL0902]|uniref:hypothetical protein n=1 Tax=Leptolyngbya sp. BL0902 TaxID=1115757 RepID=UPI00193732B7|nr:hypothetical protein [Leptolyngbya sp. BL0902]QQE64929.1 hypothetical protein GFS31_16130 [Leptolyngbya sp. BL0902]